MALEKEKTKPVIYTDNRTLPKEVDHWLAQIGQNALAIRPNAYSCRTFFIVNPDELITARAVEFCQRWSDHKVSLHKQV